MKKITALFMGFMLVLGLTACGNNEKSQSSVKKATTPQQLHPPEILNPYPVRP